MHTLALPLTDARAWANEGHLLFIASEELDRFVPRDDSSEAMARDTSSFVIASEAWQSSAERPRRLVLRSDSKVIAFLN